MISVTQIADTLREILEEEANALARETGFIQRERAFNGADFAQMLIFGWWEEPEITLDGLTQVAQRREVQISASGLNQRFTPQAVAKLRAAVGAAHAGPPGGGGGSGLIAQALPGRHRGR